ncbi:hypothetical protein ACQ4M4_26490 [Leptolyngbya sp. AN02str]|uniref:hypothetical protein n=1 Tax=Leptolyngbya sp. AN02str TaxID=3423363 RepID=UPI003D315937
MSFLSRIFGLRENETMGVITLSLIFLSNAIAQKVSEISSISNFINDVGVSQILIVWIIDGAILILTTGLQSLLIDRFDRITLLKGVSIGLAIAYVLLRLLVIFGAPSGLTYAIFYLLSQQQAFFLPLVLWLVASDMFEVAQTQRLFPFIANWELVGNLVGIGCAALAPLLFVSLNTRPEELLMFNILIYLLIVVATSVGLKRNQLRAVHHKTETMQETLTEGWGFIREVPAFRFLSISLFCVWICDTILEFHFFRITESAFAESGTYQTFYSLIVLARILGYMAIQSFLTQRLITGIGLKNTFVISPVFSLMGTVCMIGLPNLMGAISGIFTHKLPLFSVSETAYKSLQGLVPEERRGRVSIFMDSYLNSAGSILAAILLGCIVLTSTHLSVQPHTVYLAIAFLAGLIALWAALRMRSVYEASLLNWRLKRRRRGKSVLDTLDL